jgi:mannose-6-phosphate isomerase
MPLPPAILFAPIYKERPWGAQAIARIGNHPPIPSVRRIGESWELVDRPGDESVVADGPFKGKTLRALLDAHGAELMGCPWPRGQRFPLLVKVLDAAERLSLQVHPPAGVAPALGGEPKTEMWFLLDAATEAALLAGFRRGVTRAEFERCLRAGENAKLEAMIHRLPVKQDDAIFIPSGRIHAIDAGGLILEIQQNSDTTYRVFDWGRVGLDGKPRQLHIEESLRSIDFKDFEPALAPREEKDGVRLLAECPHFRVELWQLDRERKFDGHAPAVLHAIGGACEVRDGADTIRVPQGATALLPAAPCHLSGPPGARALLALNPRSARPGARKAPRAWPAPLRAIAALVAFSRELVANPRHIGAAVPSSRALARRMASHVIPSDGGFVVEVGAGTGAVTEALLERGVPPDRLIAVERSERLAEHLRRHFPHVNVVTGDAGDLRALLRHHGDLAREGVSAVISSLPLRSLPREDAARIAEEFRVLLRPGGVLIQFTYSLRTPSHWTLSRFKHLRGSVIWGNLPPARVDVFQPV